ncbi:MAG: glycosyltransferase family 4 protein [Chlorobium sp.]|nr:glycosyltransferase family 4 protein [Chlorobium sp.]
MSIEKQTINNLVVVSNGVTPYGVHFLKRVAAELCAYRLKTIYSYEFSMGRWSVELPDSINACIVGKDEDASGKRSFFSEICRGRELIREIKKAKPSAIMILGYSPMSHFMVLEWCKSNSIPCLMWGDSNIKGDNNTILKRVLKQIVVNRAISRCAALLSCGSLGAQYFKRYGAKCEQIFFVPNEPDYSLIENIIPAIIDGIVNEFDFQPARHRMLYSGRLVNVKRVDLLLDSFAAIADQRPDWDLVIAGSGSMEVELKIRVPDCIRNRIVWTGFIDSTERMTALYKCCDVLVLPSDYEPWALVINEATCAGLAIISSDVVGAAAELVHDGVNGRLFRPSDKHSLIDAILDVTQEENLTKYKLSSQEILNVWRNIADPVQGLQNALIYALKK